MQWRATVFSLSINTYMHIMHTFTSGCHINSEAIDKIPSITTQLLTLLLGLTPFLSKKSTHSVLSAVAAAKCNAV